ncbi:helix-turn-helix domain-containing protein [Patescibacteria group bacterium]|nr:helix-turn-helix domain-containing protein [Patescibacteria group bacterium]
MDRFRQKLLPIKDAAAYLGVSAATLRRWHDDGTFKATFVSPGKHRYYSFSDLGRKTKGLFRIAQDWVNAESAVAPDDDFYCSTSDRFKIRHENMTHEMEKLSALQNIASLISSAAGEIGNNSFDHNLGNWPDIRGMFFAYDLGKRIIVLADRGVGVLATLRRIRPDLKTDEEALKTAFTEFVTGRAPEHRGNGLKYVRAALSQADANLFFQSGEAVFEMRKGSDAYSITKADIPIRGSLSRITY